MTEQSSSRARRPTPLRQFTLAAAITCTAMSLAFAAPGGDKGPPADKGKPAKESPSPTATPEATSSPTNSGGGRGGSGAGGGGGGAGAAKKTCPLPDDYLVKTSSKRSSKVQSPEKPPQLFAICHNGKILCVPETAYSAHISHGDTPMGSCTKMGNNGPCTE